MLRIAVTILGSLAGCTGGLAPVDSDSGDPGDDTAADTASTDTDSDTDTDEPDPVDSDGDGWVDGDDNCVDVPNPDQGNADGDSFGDACDEDGDNDGIPDDHDPYPDDGDRPGTAASERIYAHTSSQLYTFDVRSYDVQLVGPFELSGGGLYSVTDIAIDRWGVLYAVTFSDLYVCHPQTVECWHIAPLSGSFNGLTFVPAGTVHPTEDALVGITESGQWRHLEASGGSLADTSLGTYGGSYRSSGDAVSIKGVGTFATVDAGSYNDVLVSVDPNTGAVLSEIATLSGYSSTFGLAGWTDFIFAFDSSGAIIAVDPLTGDVDVVANPGISWWGAGVRTVLDAP